MTDLAPVRIEVDMTHRLLHAQAALVEALAVRVDHVHKPSYTLMITSVRVTYTRIFRAFTKTVCNKSFPIMFSAYNLKEVKDLKVLIC